MVCFFFSFFLPTLLACLRLRGFVFSFFPVVSFSVLFLLRVEDWVCFLLGVGDHVGLRVPLFGGVCE